jgi:hypothetical protein
MRDGVRRICHEEPRLPHQFHPDCDREDIETAIDAWCELFDAPRPEVRVTEAVANEINRGEDVLCSHHDGAVSGGRSLAAAQ